MDQWYYRICKIRHTYQKDVWYVSDLIPRIRKKLEFWIFFLFEKSLYRAFAGLCIDFQDTKIDDGLSQTKLHESRKSSVFFKTGSWKTNPFLIFEEFSMQPTWY